MYIDNFHRAILVVFALSVSGAALAQGRISGTEFNPALSFVLDGKFSSYSRDLKVEPFEVPGFLLPEEAGLPAEGFSLSETEFVASANIDDKFYGFITVALELEDGETGIELEEAWFQTLTLPVGLGVKAGQMFSSIGYHNIKHPHSWDFVNAPLPYAVFLGTTFADTGVQLRWVAPTVLFIELGGELMGGYSFPAAGGASRGTGVYTVFAKFGGDVGQSNAWTAGISFLSAEAEGRESVIDAQDSLFFTGESDVLILDFVWKWAQNGNPRQRNFMFATEYLRRKEDGVVDRVTPGAPESGTYDGTQDGFYIYGVYQWRPKWRVGLRYDQISPDNRVNGLSMPTLLDDNSSTRRLSAMVDWSHSEFSRLRFEVNETEAGTDNLTAVFVQYIMSIGSHGAHRF